jgi:glycosyltransferase involved in cell wall biosynthesis
MKFTVVIPLYNKERHIERAIKSVLNQIFQGFEVIVVDDGSTDNSLTQLIRIKDNRIRIIKKKNGGVSSARNKGIDEANYDYIGFLDADDMWKPDFLESIKNLIDKYPKAGAYCTAFEIKKEDGTLVASPNFNYFKKDWHGIIDDYFKYALNGPLISASSIVIPKRVFNNIGGFPLGIKRGEDLDMWMRIALNYDIAYFNRVCATYFRNAENRACNKKSKLIDSSSSYAEDILIEIKELGSHSIYFEEYMVKRIIDKARYMIEEDNRKEARKLLYKYRFTKFNKKALIKTFISSWIPTIIKKYF